jgi:predicted transcriptional regulator
MKVKKVKINLKSLEDVGGEITQVMRAVESGEAVSPKRHEIVFSDFAALRSFLTPKRLDVARFSTLGKLLHPYPNRQHDKR